MVSKMTFAAAALMCAATVFAAGAEAQPRSRHVQGSVETPRGVYQGEASVARSQGMRTRNASVTGPNGGQTSVQDSRAWSRAEGTYSRDRTRTFANGDTRSLDVDAARTAPGEFSATRTITGRNGETRTQTGQVQITRP